MLGPACGRNLRFTLHFWVFSFVVNCKCTDSKLKPAAPLVIVARWDENDANFSSGHGCGSVAPRPPPPRTLVYAFPGSSHTSGAVACFFFFIILLAFPFFYFLFPPPLLSLPLHDPYFTHSSIKGWGGLLCVHVCIIWIPEAWRLWSVFSRLSFHQHVSVQIIQLKSISTYSDLVSRPGS